MAIKCVILHQLLTLCKNVVKSKVQKSIKIYHFMALKEIDSYLCQSIKYNKNGHYSEIYVKSTKKCQVQLCAIKVPLPP